MDESLQAPTSQTSASLSKSKHISVGQFYKGTQVTPTYQERNKPPTTTTTTEEPINKYFEYNYTPRSRLLGVSKFIESIIKASRASVPQQDPMRLSTVSTEGEERNKNVVCPESINLSEWIAAHIILFHNYANSELYIKYCSKEKDLSSASKSKKNPDEVKSEVEVNMPCNRSCCPSMTAGNKAEYLWADGKSVKQPTSIPASKYIYHVLEWTAYELNESGSFPRKDNAPYADHFVSSTARRIIKRQFRIFAHFQYTHLKDLEEADRKMFVAYLRQLLGLVQEYKLMDSKEASVLISSSSHKHSHKKDKKRKKDRQLESSNNS